jgi:hypothetical protein
VLVECKVMSQTCSRQHPVLRNLCASHEPRESALHIGFRIDRVICRRLLDRSRIESKAPVDTPCPSPQSRSTAWHRRRMFLSRFGTELESRFCTRHRRDSWQFSKILATTPCGCLSTSVDAVLCHVSIGYWLLICDDDPSREDLFVIS